MINSKNIWLIVLVIYIALTFIKLFVGIVHPMGGTSVYLVAKKYPTINNEWILGEENSENKELHRGKWYYEGKYTIIAKGENGVFGEGILRVLTKTWWIVTFAAVFIILLKFLILSVRKINNK